MTRLLFSKTGRARYISHLDTMRTFQRAFQRAGLEVGHTEGFNPHPYVSILLPLPLGFSSECEILEFRRPEDTVCGEIPRRMNEALPEGLEVTDCWDGGEKVKDLKWADYELELEGHAGMDRALTLLLGRDSLPVPAPSKKDPDRVVDVIPAVRSLEMRETAEGVNIACRVSAREPGLNPKRIPEALELYCPDLAPTLVRIHRAAVLDAEGRLFR